MSITKEKVSKNIIWRIAESSATQIINYLVSLLLARKLGPEVYGDFAIAGTVISFLLLFIDMGLPTVLIQKKDADDRDYMAVFIYDLFSGLVLYLIVFLTAPLIAAYYHKTALCEVVRVLGLKIILTAFQSIQSIYITKHIAFKKFFFASLTGTILAGVAGVYCVYAGYGIWSLVSVSIIDIAVDTVFLWFMAGWKPSRRFSFSSLLNLLKKGSYYLFSSLLCNLSGSLNSLIIGKKYTSSDLGYYSKGSMLPERIFVTINSTIESVMFPVLSSESGNGVRVKEIQRRTIKTSSFIVLPALAGLAAVSPALISFVLTDAWLPAVPFVILFCISSTFEVIQSANLNTIKSMGRGDLYFKIEIVRRVLSLLAIVITMWISPIAMAVGVAVSTLLSQLFISIPVKKLIDYSFGEQVKDILPHLLLSLFMAVVVWFIGKINLPNIAILLIQVASGILIYFTIALIFKYEALQYSLPIFKGWIDKKIKK